MEQLDTGILLNKQDIELHRMWFKDMVNLIGIKVLFYSPKKDMQWDGYGELETYYNPPSIEGCIFEEHPNPKTVKKLGWNTDREETFSIIHLPYDLQGLQVGALVAVPSNIDNGKARIFRIIDMSSIMVYPASIACKIAPQYKNEFSKSQLNHKHDDFNLLRSVEEEEEQEEDEY